MALRLKRGMGRTPAEDAVCKSSFAGGFFSPVCWSMLTPSTVAPPAAPPQDVWTVPPASGEDAQATVDALLNQQLRDQQALNAAGVKSSWWDSFTGGVSQVGDSAKSVLPWGLLALGLGSLAVIAFVEGSPRRYGR